MLFKCIDPFNLNIISELNGCIQIVLPRTVWELNNLYIQVLKKKKRNFRALEIGLFFFSLIIASASFILAFSLSFTHALPCVLCLFHHFLSDVPSGYLMMGIIYFAASFISIPSFVFAPSKCNFQQIFMPGSSVVPMCHFFFLPPSWALGKFLLSEWRHHSHSSPSLDAQGWQGCDFHLDFTNTGGQVGRHKRTPVLLVPHLSQVLALWVSWALIVQTLDCSQQVTYMFQGLLLTIGTHTDLPRIRPSSSFGLTESTGKTIF